ncbi:MAG TPA: 5'/3'-nucleotidase SurE [Planctomycetota bacterium]
MRILLSNDDSVAAAGLHQLAEELRKLGDVFIAAPDRVRSGASSALTIAEPILATEVGKDIWSVTGTPADSVKLAIHELMKRPPDVVVSGINNGLNTGSNVLYSGTVAAALEGAQYGITAFAISRPFGENDRFRSEAKLSAKVVAKLMSGRLGRRTAYNINLPPNKKPRGVLVTTVEPRPYQDRFDKRVDPRGRTYYWLRGTPPREVPRNGRASDDWAIENGYVSVTPLRRDLTDASLLDDAARAFPKQD